MSSYKLIYLDGRAVGEAIRWIFKLADVPFEDFRISLADMGTLKTNPRCPLGQVPVLEEDGRDLTQSQAIGRYLCKKFGFQTDDPFLEYRTMQVTDIMQDCWTVFYRPFVVATFMGSDEDTRNKLKEDLLNIHFPRHFKQISEILQETEGNYVAGNQITWADIYVANWLNIFEDVVSEGILEDFPSLRKLKQVVMDLPGLKEWISIRPKTPF